VAAGKLPGEARAGWRVLRALAGELGIAGFDFTDFAGLRAGLAPRDVAVATSAAPATTGEGYELAISEAIYRVDAVTRRAAALQAHPLTVGPRVTLHPLDAAATGVADGAMAKLSNAFGTATLQVVLDDRVAAGSAWVERGYGATAALAAGDIKVVAA